MGEQSGSDWKRSLENKSSDYKSDYMFFKDLDKHSRMHPLAHTYIHSETHTHTETHRSYVNLNNIVRKKKKKPLQQPYNERIYLTPPPKARTWHKVDFLSRVKFS